MWPFRKKSLLEKRFGGKRPRSRKGHDET